MHDEARVPEFAAQDLAGRPFTDRDLLAKTPALIVLLRGFA